MSPLHNTYLSLRAERSNLTQRVILNEVKNLIRSFGPCLRMTVSQSDRHVAKAPRDDKKQLCKDLAVILKEGL
jgi:hypothetical protein